MPAIQFPRVASGMSTEQLADLVARCLKEVEWLANGNMDSRNIRNIAGYNVGPDVLKHSSGIVGMNGADPTNLNAIRFWSGNANPAIASFRVTQGGILTAVGAQFQSSTGYPRVEINSTSNLVAAYSSATNYVALSPTTGGAPSISWFSGGVPTGAILSLAGLFEVLSFNSAPMLVQSDLNLTLRSSTQTNLDPASNLQINGVNGVSGTVYVSATNGGVANIPISFIKGIRTS